MVINSRIPHPSLAERDRRHLRVRKAMAESGIDVLLLPANTGRWEQLQADSRYLTSIGGFGTEVFTVFPVDGEVTAYVFNRASWWKTVQDWVPDVRDGHNKWAENAMERLTELNFRKGTIGVVGLAGLFRAPDGVIPYTTVSVLENTFPNARFVNATELMQQIRAIKSDEEVQFMQQSARIVDKMIETMAETATVGIEERQLYASMTQVMLKHGGELPTLFFLATGPEVRQSSFVPTGRMIQPGDRIVNEIEAKYGGYAAQAVRPMVLGKPSHDYQAMVALSATCFHAVVEQIQPGVTFGELFDRYTATVERCGDGKYTWSHPMMHARGLGDDGPALLGERDLQRFRRIQLEPGMVFVVKPQIRAAKGNERASIGDSIVVTEKGARRLGTYDLNLIVKQ